MGTLLLFLIGLSVMYGFGSLTKKKLTQFNLDNLYKKWGGLESIPPNLLKAIAIVESDENPNAVNASDPSYGLMQLLCTESSTRICGNSLNIQNWPPESREQLFDPNYNVEIAAKILNSNIKSYGLQKGIAVYNCWGARYDSKNGPFRNQVYVDKVMKTAENVKL